MSTMGPLTIGSNGAGAFRVSRMGPLTIGSNGAESGWAPGGRAEPCRILGQEFCMTLGSHYTLKRPFSAKISPIHAPARH